MAQVNGLVLCREGIQGGKIYRIVRTSEWIDIDISGIERSEILEEMGPLAGIDAESRQGASGASKFSLHRKNTQYTISVRGENILR